MQKHYLLLLLYFYVIMSFEIFSTDYDITYTLYFNFAIICAFLIHLFPLVRSLLAPTSSVHTFITQFYYLIQ